MKVNVVKGGISLSAKLADDGTNELADQLRGVLNGTITVQPPLPDPGPNPQWQALLDAALGNSVLYDLVGLHQPQAVCYPASIRWQCLGDEFGGYDAEAPDWPCPTIEIIALHLGVEVGGPLEPIERDAAVTVSGQWDHA